MDNLTTGMHGGVHRQGTRMAMWHEAGHAAVATAMGAPVRYVGLDPIPHALAVQRGLTKH